MELPELFSLSYGAAPEEEEERSLGFSLDNVYLW